MIKISLARAFIIRKRIKDEVEHLIQKLQYADLRISTEDFPKAEDRIDIRNDYSETLNTYLSYSNILADFNTAIDAANAQGPRSYLNKIEVLRRRLNLFERIAAQQSGLRLEERYYDSYEYNEQTKQLGIYKTRVYEKATDVDFVKMTEDTKKELQKLEDSLSEENAKTFITFDGELANALKAEGFIDE